MIIPKEIKSIHDDRIQTYNDLKNTLTSIILPFCEENGYAFQIRIKEILSLVDKIQTGRYDSYQDLDDIVAASIIVPTLSHIDKVISFFNVKFIKHQIKKRGSSLKAPEKFIYDSTRYIGKLKRFGLHQEEYLIYNQLFEIQVRTAFEYAWSTATHSLTYKTNTLTWEKLRLTAQIKASVEQLDMLISGFEEINQHVVKSTWPKLEIQKAISIFLNSKFEEKVIPRELQPKSMSRLTENIIKLLNYSENVNQTKYKKTIRDMMKILNQIIDKLSTSYFPRSLTLMQTIIGELLELEPNIFDEIKHPLLITEELIDLYPKTKNIKNIFKIK